MMEPALMPMMFEKRSETLFGLGKPFVIVEEKGCIRESAYGKTVPIGQTLVVKCRWRPLPAPGKKPAPRSKQ
jgi:hypothetical protein